MSKSRRPNYFAVDRGIFEHPLLRPTKAFTRIEAWEWLISRAAWKPRGEPNRFGIIHNERGQLSITRRQLAKQWNCSKSRVDRLLRRLAADGMVVLGKAYNGPKSGPKNEPIIGYPMTMITLCNYDKFQAAVKTNPRSEFQKAGQKAGQKLPQLPGLLYEIASKPSKTINIRKLMQESAKGTIGKNRPTHGKTSKGLIFIYREHNEEWAKYAADFEAVTGAAIAPRRYLDGLGNWFVMAGEAYRARLEQSA